MSDSRLHLVDYLLIGNSGSFQEGAPHLTKIDKPVAL